MKAKLIIFLSAGILMFGCENDSTSTQATLEIDAVVEQSASVGWEVNRMASSSNEISLLTGENDYTGDAAIGKINSAEKMKTQAVNMRIEAVEYLPKQMSLSKTTGDSLYYFEESVNQSTGFGVRKALYYNSETGIARFYETIFQFPTWMNMEYDSSEIKISTNYTLEDESDDYIVSLYKLQNFRDSFFINYIESALTVTGYDENDVTGFTASMDAYYNEGMNLSHLRQAVVINIDQSGTLREDFDFRDGKTAYNSVTFYANHTGEFSKMLRNGTSISGTFDSVEDDLSGSYTEMIDFPEGSYIDQIYRSAGIEITLPDSILNILLEEAIYFESGNIDSSSAEITVQNISGVKTTVMNIVKSNSAHGTITVEERDSENTISGNWTTRDNYYIVFEAESYFDGSSHLYYEVYLSETAYDNGDPALITGDYTFAPDQTGQGTLFYKGKSYLITFSDSAQAEVSSDGESASISLF
ncbi:MAG: hypothetical protein AB7T22_12450 [Calditrichaceae bacterium]